MSETRRAATVVQNEIWLANEREPDTGRWNIQFDVVFDGPVDEAAARAAVDDVVARHPQLRSRFAVENGRLEQVVVAEVRVPVLVHRRAEPQPGPAQEAWAHSLGWRPLALHAAPLIRADLLSFPGGGRLSVTVHHIVADGWSLDVLGSHLIDAYLARRDGTVPDLGVPLPPEPSDAGESLAYWRELLAGEWTPLAPLPDLVREGTTPGPAAHVVATLSQETLAGLRTLAAGEHHLTPAVAVLAAWSLLLHAWTDTDDGLLGMPFSGRFDESAYEEVGLYTVLLPVRTRLVPDDTFLDLAGRLAEQVLDSLEHSDVDPGALRRVGVPAGHRAVYAHQREPAGARDGIRLVLRDEEAAKYDLALACVDSPDRMRLRIDYDTAVLSRPTAQALLQQLAAIVAEVAARPEQDCRVLLTGRAHPSAVAPTAARDWVSLPDRVRAHAAERPAAVAVRQDDDVLTYGDLVARADGVAHWLRDHDVAPGDLVALLMRPGITNIVLVLGVSFAGAAYLPLDPDYPAAQLETILTDARPRLVLDAIPLDTGPAAPVGVAVTATMTLNVLYTSGSTGRPKGVVLPHGGLARLMGRPEFIPIDDSDVVSHLSPLNFDGASYEIWGALAHGAELVVLPKTLVLSPRELRDELRRYGVTTLLVTTPLLNRLIEDAPETLQTLRRVFFGGELISVPHMTKALKWCGPGVLLHSYGPTENSFTSSWHPIDQLDERARTVPIGSPVPGTEAHIVFAGTLDPVPVGVPGELVLGGDGVADCYLGNPDQTAAAFVDDPFSGRPGARLYRTGDRVRWTPDGLLEFVGRRDNQVKIRSQRVELGEVESVLRSHPTVESAFVTTVRNGRDEKEIVAYYVLAAPVPDADVRAYLRDRLPGFAVPGHLVPLSTLPLNDNGKIDRSRLPAPTARPVAQSTLDSPVHDAWSAVLERTDLDGDVNFFDAGGHSLLLVRLQEALRERGVALSIAQLLQHTTIDAQVAATGTATTVRRQPVHYRRTPADEPVAIVGMAGVFAGAPDLDGFWDNLVAGRDCITSGADPVVSELADGRRRVARYGLLDAPDAFDGALFGFTADELDGIDPQHGILYECLWAAVENAGLLMADIAPRTSLYAGRSRRVARTPTGEGFRRVDEVVGSESTFLATRFAYWNDLRSEAVMVEAACSTSLVAVHLACESLRRGSSDFALAGGVAIGNPPGGSYVYTPGQLFSSDGYCRPLDERASGTVPGDGAGAVLLRRLSDAERAGDPIYAVIRGSAVNNEGRLKVGYTAPSVDGQAAVLRAAHTNAGVDPRDVGFVEPHGTGTRLGDTIEAIALTGVLGPDGAPTRVGGLKASIGHTDTAAGVAGLIKATLAVSRGYIPATPNVDSPLPELGGLGGRFSLVPEGVAWTDDERPRLAGVSSFGVGGTNAHVIVEQHRGSRP